MRLVVVDAFQSRHAENGDVPALGIWSLQSNPRHADVFFPQLLDYADIPSPSPDFTPDSPDQVSYIPERQRQPLVLMWSML